MMLRRFMFALIFTLTALTAVAQSPAVRTLTPTDCPFDIPDAATVDCAVLTVPERHANPNGATLQLAVAVLRAGNGNAKPDPVLYLEGGPGGSALTGLDAWVGIPLTADRDFILFDQRGTGYSEPGLFCERYEYDFDVDAADSPTYYKACAQFLEADGIDLSAYNSAESAADVAMLVRALGYQQVNLYGISYGTRIALTVMRDHAEVVRAVVLDSPYPPQVQGFEQQAPNGWSAMHALFEACAADFECDDAIPDLERRFGDFVQMTEIDPIFYDFGDGEYDYYGTDFIDMLFELMYDTAAIPYIPAALNELINGDPQAFADLHYGDYEDDDESLTEEDVLSVDDSDGVFNSVHCTEEIPFNDLSVAEAQADPIPDAFQEGLYLSVEDQFAVCAAWDVEALGAIETQPVVSDVPTLVLVGQFDPITPPIWGEASVSTLSRGTLVVMPGAGHSVIDSGDCGAALGVAFLDNPTQTLDSSCVADVDVWFSPIYWED